MGPMGFFPPFQRPKCLYNLPIGPGIAWFFWGMIKFTSNMSYTSGEFWFWQVGLLLPFSSQVFMLKQKAASGLDHQFFIVCLDLLKLIFGFVPCGKSPPLNHHFGRLCFFELLSNHPTSKSKSPLYAKMVSQWAAVAACSGCLPGSPTRWTRHN